MIDFAAMPLGDVAALNTPEALDYFWSHVGSGYFEDRVSFYADVVQYVGPIIDYYKYPHIVDYGCGCGDLLLKIREQFHVTYFCGVDYSLTAIQKTEMKFSHLWGETPTFWNTSPITTGR
jgi:SAM-dependent methyltransferase